MDCTTHELADSLRTKFEALPPLSSKCCIYRVPRTVREVNTTAYTPCLVSVGPYHSSKKRLKSMQDHKLRFLQDFLRRNEEKSVKDYLMAIRLLEKEAREYYVETINLSSEEFLEMLLVDGVFIIEFLLKWYNDKADEIDCVFSKPSLEYVIKRDLLLLENQLPFFILDVLYSIAFKEDTSLPSLIDLTGEILVEEKDISKKFIDSEVLHLVDFLRTYHLPSSLRQQGDGDGENDADDEDLVFPQSVERLHDAGVKFVVAKSKQLLDITFDGGVLRIPRLEVEDHTGTLLLNLSAFEQCHYHTDSYIVDYVILMDVLITSLKDVDILMSSDVISNYLGSHEDVADLFNTICRGAAYQERKFYYSDICKKLNKYSKSPWNRWRATLSHDYFSNPWTIISVVVAIFLLILTVIQTACSVHSLRY